MSSMCTKCINFYVSRSLFFKNVTLLICFSNLIYMYFYQGLKNFEILKMIYLDFLLNFSKIEIYFLLVYGGIVVKMDNSHLFEMYLKFLFHAWAKMDNEIYLHVHVC